MDPVVERPSLLTRMLRAVLPSDEVIATHQHTIEEKGRYPRQVTCEVRQGVFGTALETCEGKTERMSAWTLKTLHVPQTGNHAVQPAKK